MHVLYCHKPGSASAKVSPTSPLVGQKVRKFFDDGWFVKGDLEGIVDGSGWFVGRIVSEVKDRPGVFSVVYPADGDNEEMLRADARFAAKKYKAWNPEDLPSLKSLCGNDDAAVQVLVNLGLADFWVDVYQRVRIYVRNSDLEDHRSWAAVANRTTWASFKKLSEQVPGGPAATLRFRMQEQWKKDRVALRLNERQNPHKARAARGQTGWTEQNKARAARGETGWTEQNKARAARGETGWTEQNKAQAARGETGWTEQNKARAARGETGWTSHNKDRRRTKGACDICAYPPNLFEGRCSCGSVAYWVAPETHLSNAELLTKNEGLLVAQCSYAGPVVPRHHIETSGTLFNIALCQMNIFLCDTYPATTRSEALGDAYGVLRQVLARRGLDNPTALVEPGRIGFDYDSVGWVASLFAVVGTCQVELYRLLIEDGLGGLVGTRVCWEDAAAKKGKGEKDTKKSGVPGPTTACRCGGCHCEVGYVTKRVFQPVGAEDDAQFEVRSLGGDTRVFSSTRLGALVCSHVGLGAVMPPSWGNVRGGAMLYAGLSSLERALDLDTSMMQCCRVHPNSWALFATGLACASRLGKDYCLGGQASHLKLAYVGAGRNQAKTMMVLQSLVVKRERLVGEVGGCLGTYSRRWGSGFLDAVGGPYLSPGDLLALSCIDRATGLPFSGANGRRLLVETSLKCHAALCDSMKTGALRPLMARRHPYAFVNSKSLVMDHVDASVIEHLDSLSLGATGASDGAPVPGVLDEPITGGASGWAALRLPANAMVDLLGSGVEGAGIVAGGDSGAGAPVLGGSGNSIAVRRYRVFMLSSSSEFSMARHSAAGGCVPQAALFNPVSSHAMQECVGNYKRATEFKAVATNGTCAVCGSMVSTRPHATDSAGPDMSRWAVPDICEEPSDTDPLHGQIHSANLVRTWFDDTFLHERACVQGIPVDCLRRVQVMDLVPARRAGGQACPLQAGPFPSDSPKLELCTPRGDRGLGLNLAGQALDAIVAALQSHPAFPARGIRESRRVQAPLCTGSVEVFWPGDLVEVCYAVDKSLNYGTPAQHARAVDPLWTTWKNQVLLGVVQTVDVGGFCHVLLADYPAQELVSTVCDEKDQNARHGLESVTLRLEDRPPSHHLCRGGRLCPYRIQYHGFKGYGTVANSDMSGMYVLLDDRTWEGGKSSGFDGDGFRRNGFDVDAWDVSGQNGSLGTMRTCQPCHVALEKRELPKMSLLRLLQHRVPLAVCYPVAKVGACRGGQEVYERCSKASCSCNLAPGNGRPRSPNGGGRLFIEEHISLLPELNEATREAVALARARSRIVRLIPSSTYDRRNQSTGVSASDAARTKKSRPLAEHTPGNAQGTLQRMMLRHTIQFPQNLSELYRLIDEGGELPGPTSFATALEHTKVVSVSPRDSEEALLTAIENAPEFTLDVIGGRDLMRILICFNPKYAGYSENVLGDTKGTPSEAMGQIVVLGEEQRVAARRAEVAILASMAGPTSHDGSGGQHTRSGIMQTSASSAATDDLMQAAAKRLNDQLGVETPSKQPEVGLKPLYDGAAASAQPC